MNFRIRVSQPRVRVTAMLAEYPAHPSVQTLEPDDPDATFMLSRLDLYRQGREPLGDMANLCLTVLEDSASQATAAKGGKRSMAARHYRVAKAVLDTAGMLNQEGRPRRSKRLRG